MPERRAAQARRVQEAGTASTTAICGDTIVGADDVTACPMTPEAHGPRTPFPNRGVVHGAEAGSDVQLGRPPSPKEEAPLDMEIEYEQVSIDDDTSGSQSAEKESEPDPERDIFDRDDLYASDDSDEDTDDELADQVRMGYHMDTLLSDQ